MAVSDLDRQQAYQTWARGVTVITDATTLPVSLDTAKRHLNITTDYDNDVIAGLLEVARATVEERTQRALITQTLDVTYDAPPGGGGPWLLPRGPVASVTSVTTYNSSNVSAVLSSAAYRLDSVSLPPRLLLNSGYSWPSDVRDTTAAVIRIVAGYGATPALVPAPLRQAMLLLVAHWYENREQAVLTGAVPQQIPFGVEQLWAPYRAWWI